MKIEAVAKSGIPSKNEPFVLTDEAYRFYWDNMENEVESLVTFEDLNECKCKRQIATLFWNATWAYASLKLKGAVSSECKVAFVAYDDFGDFPVWVIVADNYASDSKLYIKYYDAASVKDRNEFSWAIRTK